MAGFQARSHARTRVSACVHDVFPIMMLRLVEQGLNSWLGKAPCSSVQRLLLAPYDCFGVRIRVQVFPKLGPGEGVQLLNAGDGGVHEAFRGAMLV